MPALQQRMYSEPVSGTLSTLREDLDKVSLDDIDISCSKPKKVHKSPSQVFVNNFNNNTSPNNVKGLGINLPRRPSDSMFKNLNQPRYNNNNTSQNKVSMLERPVSNDSITSSNGSDFSEGGNSRNSSITSASFVNSPIMAQHINGSSSSISQDSKYQLPSSANQKYSNGSQLSINKLRDSVSTPRLNKYPSMSSMASSIPSTPVSASSVNISNSTINTLTPSQKYRLRRQNSKTSTKQNLRKREKYFDELYSDEETIDDNMIWNVPFTKGSATIFSPSSGKSSKMLKNVITQSPAQMPLSPLPGSLSAPSTPITRTPHEKGNDSGSYFYQNPDEAASISQFYQASSESFVATELSSRQSKGASLPSSIKEASELGFDDMKFISKEKSECFSSTRPIWLPPKSKDESKKHDRDITKMFESAAKHDKKKQEYRDALQQVQDKNIKRWGELEERGILRNSTQNEMKKLVFKTSIPESLRLKIWTELLNDKTKETDYETFDELNKKFKTIPSFPKSKLYEIEKIVESIYPKLGKFQNGQALNESLIKLIELKSISTRGMEYGDELTFALLLLKFEEREAYDLNNKLKFGILNEVLLNKFNENSNKNSVLKKYLNNKEYKDDYEFLNSNSIFDILQNFSTDISYHILDILIILNDYKYVYALFLTILRDYHFGFMNLKVLKSNDEILVPDEYQFFDRLNHFYKKF
ncbi:hypothetical protein BN7_5879 [Wickerhamomyces ciferrii]|uniref:Rab-GAP TBC domain-containing protein n=1 Tax=Wickerhamomyces ciferrii (strain ATCC 14091 / BCRC 22168 / CBS 111 / JCM 3599 / NBRC 0793 / NRRL Y-1031 F-60-10) TaxID=1206466 RepID=K0KWE6_WICCF|nr:uncharacterized protein BN7_5879 [Wickerhamomyces ciferrii]CCH46287.1 hypothetical protein BN7_5879 [Wickerhamomyces ciferrii]